MVTNYQIYFFIGSVLLLIWLGFRFADAIRSEPQTPPLVKLKATGFYIIIGIISYNIFLIAALVIPEYQEAIIGLSPFSNSDHGSLESHKAGFMPGTGLNFLLNSIIVFIQIHITWFQKS
jgi:hypothetical protein